MGVSFNVLNLWTVAGAPRVLFPKKRNLGFATVRTYPLSVNLNLSVDVTASSERRRAAIGLLVREGPPANMTKYHVMFACVLQGRVIRSIKTSVYKILF